MRVWLHKQFINFVYPTWACADVFNDNDDDNNNNNNNDFNMPHTRLGLSGGDWQ